MVESLRERYEAGTLDEALFPESPDLLELLADIFPELSRDGPPT